MCKALYCNFAIIFLNPDANLTSTKLHFEIDLKFNCTLFYRNIKYQGMNYSSIDNLRHNPLKFEYSAADKIISILNDIKHNQPINNNYNLSLWSIVLTSAGVHGRVDKSTGLKLWCLCSECGFEPRLL